MKLLAIVLLLISTANGQDFFFPDEIPDNLKPTSVVGSTTQNVDNQLASALNITNRQNFVFDTQPTSSSVCVTPTGERGTCGPLSQCRNYIPLIQQLNNPTVNRFFRERICRLLRQSVHICCPAGSPILPFGNGSPNPTNVASNGVPSIIPSELECGLPGGSRVTGGFEVKPGNWPWLAAIGQRTARNGFFANCGGALITNRHVLTAAHCFGGNQDPTLVRLGEHHLDNDFAGERPQEYRIVSRRSHNYVPRTNENDLSILTLDRDVIFNDFVRPACLPFNFKNEDFLGNSLTVVGWGRTAFENRVTSKVPMQADVPVVNRDQCFRAYQRLRNKPVVDSRHLCAGVGGQDSCNGDSGGPLNYLDLNRGRYYLVGLVSFGVECARPDFPGVYTRISSFLDWILQNVQ